MEEGRKKLMAVQQGATNTISSAAGFIRANPWMMIAGATLLGGLIVTFGKSRKPANIDAIRDWLGDAYSKLSHRENAKAGMCGLWKSVGRKFRHLAQ